jgi:hypothetical protein
MKTLAILVLIFLSAVARAESGDPVDPARLNRATIVLRAKLVEGGEGSKYLLSEVVVLRVFKNESGETLGKKLTVAVYSWKAGIPAGESTLYLEKYGEESTKNLWRVLEGDGAIGVSHTKP